MEYLYIPTVDALETPLEKQPTDWCLKMHSVLLSVACQG